MPSAFVPALPLHRLLLRCPHPRLHVHGHLSWGADITKSDLFFSSWALLNLLFLLVFFRRREDTVRRAKLH